MLRFQLVFDVRPLGETKMIDETHYSNQFELQFAACRAAFSMEPNFSWVLASDCEEVVLASLANPKQHWPESCLFLKDWSLAGCPMALGSPFDTLVL